MTILTKMIDFQGALLNVTEDLLSRTPIDISVRHWVAYSKRATEEDWEQFLLTLQDDGQLLRHYWQLNEYHVFLFEGPYSYLKIEDCLYDFQLAFGLGYHIDHAGIDERLDLSEPGLLIMDMDCTAIKAECINEMAIIAGTSEQVSALTEKAMHGELNFEESLRQRVALVKGVALSELEPLKTNLPWMEELALLVETFQQQNWYIAIASGGFTYFAEKLKEELNLDAIFANQLEINNGILTGELIGELIGPEQKAMALTELQNRWSIPPHNIIAIGDGANDLTMLAKAEIGIAYHAKPVVNEQANYKIAHADLGGVLCIASAIKVLKELEELDEI